MNREILFRGQTRRYGEKVNMNGDKLPGVWVYGGIFPGTGDYSIIYGGETEKELKKFVVYSDTVGQYTGKSDMDGTWAFEGDVIVPDGYTPDLATGIVRFGENRPDTSGSILMEVGYWVEWSGDTTKYWRHDLGWWLKHSRIVGNIHDGKDGRHE